MAQPPAEPPGPTGLSVSLAVYGAMPICFFQFQPDQAIWLAGIPPGEQPEVSTEAPSVAPRSPNWRPATPSVLPLPSSVGLLVSLAITSAMPPVHAAFRSRFGSDQRTTPLLHRRFCFCAAAPSGHTADGIGAALPAGFIDSWERPSATPLFESTRAFLSRSPLPLVTFFLSQGGAKIRSFSDLPQLKPM